MTTAWSHLPNAVHIDRILASIKAHPEEWSAAWRSPVLSRMGTLAAWRAAWVAAPLAARGAAGAAAGHAAGHAAWGALEAARSAIVALVAWDDSSKWLDMPSEKLQVWAALSEDSACILLLPAVIAFEKIKELELV